MEAVAGVSNAVEIAEGCRVQLEGPEALGSTERGLDLSAPNEDLVLDDILDANVSELLDRFREGDQAVMAALRGKDGSAVLLKLQDAMNQENRVYTFLSQKLNIEHETKKAIINNIR